MVRGFWHLGNSGAAVLTVRQSRLAVAAAGDRPGMDLHAWEKELDGLVAARYKGKVDFFIDGEQFFPGAHPQRSDPKGANGEGFCPCR